MAKSKRLIDRLFDSNFRKGAEHGKDIHDYIKLCSYDSKGNYRRRLKGSDKTSYEQEKKIRRII